MKLDVPGPSPTSRVTNSSCDVTSSCVMSQCVSVASQGFTQGHRAAGTRSSATLSLLPSPLCDCDLQHPLIACTSPMATADQGFGATSEMDGPWVGTWRPHRPRGPVLAQFTSPGPKYAVLGTTGHLAHNPTKTKAPAYSIPLAKLPPITSCSPGPRYFVPPEITRKGKYVSPSQNICGLPKIKTEITPGPSDYATEKANRHVFKRPPEQPMAFRHKESQSQTPGPGTYTLPRLVGPNTTYTTASPCYTMVGKRKRGGFSEDLAKTPGPAAFPKVEVDVYKTRSPTYTMASKAGAGGDRTLKPGPADYRVGRVTLIKPEAPASTFGLRHSLYTAPLIVPP